ncbi:ribonucleotide reductase subunit alpha [Rhodoferax sp. PAMC 29310]|uniref:ribonucleotide reductase subunit alpha n=1 Tax=Rhodoferax sp. PAMC 29310 TaxID=2822760 RepID=UPI001B341CFC|nr:ribonucleotide reductase subunit alpha [Rhodoferax sp. PAMC 29310]
MNISSFDDLLQAAGQQTQPQRLLFVFAGADLPKDCTPEQKASYFKGHGGELVPLMYVDKLPQELSSFAALELESRSFGKEWSIVFAAAMSGSGDKAPSSEAAEKPMQQMVEQIKMGSLASFIPFNRQGEPVNFE